MRRAIFFGAMAALWVAAAAWQMVFAADKTCDLTYDNFGRAFMQKYCVACHDSAKAAADRNGAPDKVNFDTAAGVKKAKSDIVKWVIRESQMPPEPPRPTDDEKTKLKAWLTCEY
jgi:uncharacterized membrane protein